MDSKKNIKVKGNLTTEDYSTLNKVYMRNIFKRMMGIVFIAFLIMYGILFYKRFGIVFVGVASIIASIFVYLSIFIATLYRTKRSFKNSKKSDFDFTYTISKNGIHTQSKGSGHHFYWNNISNSHVEKDLFILYISKYRSILIPKRFFTKEEDLQEFTQLIKENINN